MTNKNQGSYSRRTFLSATTAATLAASYSSASAQEAVGQALPGNVDAPEPATDRMGWAVVGLGSFAVGQVIPGFDSAKKSRIIAFISGNADKAHNLGKRYGVAKHYDYTNFDTIADDEEIDCVYIVLPVGLHAEYAIRALNAGKHVLVEKPMASTSAECNLMITTAKANNRTLGVGYRVHFEPANIAAKRLIKEGEIGDLRLVQCDHGFNASFEYPPHKWRLQKLLGGGGSMFDIGIYGVNTSLMMLGDDTPICVSAAYNYPRDDPRFTEVEGGIDWRMAMKSGINVNGSSSYCYSPYASRQRYFGSAASIEMQPATTYYDNDLVIEGSGHARTIGTGRAETQFADQVDGFVEAARAGRPHRAPGEMGLRDMLLMEAIYRSADAGGAVIEL